MLVWTLVLILALALVLVQRRRLPGLAKVCERPQEQPRAKAGLEKVAMTVITGENKNRPR